jgi:hypothetical protein
LHQDFCSAQCARLINKPKLGGTGLHKRPSPDFGIARDYRMLTGQSTWRRGPE